MVTETEIEFRSLRYKMCILVLSKMATHLLITGYSLHLAIEDGTHDILCPHKNISHLSNVIHSLYRQ